MVKAETEQSNGRTAAAKPRLQVLSSNAAVSQRIVETFGDRGLTVVDPITSHDEIDEATIDASTIFVFVCDVDEANGMAALRRLRREQRSWRSSSSRRRRPAPASAAPSTPAPTRSSSSPRSRPPSPSPRWRSPAASRWSRASSAPASNGPPSPTASARSWRSSRRGLTNSEIAERLLLAQSTVKSHLSSAFTKLGIRSRKEVTALLLDPEQAQSVGLIGVRNATADTNGNGNGSVVNHDAMPQPIA